MSDVDEKHHRKVELFKFQFEDSNSINRFDVFEHSVNIFKGLTFARTGGVDAHH